jgi:hypothetical protein
MLLPAAACGKGESDALFSFMRTDIRVFSLLLFHFSAGAEPLCMRIYTAAADGLRRENMHILYLTAFSSSPADRRSPPRVAHSRRRRRSRPRVPRPSSSTTSRSSSSPGGRPPVGSLPPPSPPSLATKLLAAAIHRIRALRARPPPFLLHLPWSGRNRWRATASAPRAGGQACGGSGCQEVEEAQ